MVPLVELQNAGYRYPDGRVALDAIDLAVAPGEAVALAGSNGSGKSTLCRVLLGLAPHLTGGTLLGHVHVAGQDVATTSPAALGRLVGLVHQNASAQLVGSTVARDLALGPAWHGVPRDEIETRVRTAAADLAIEHLLERSPNELSGGEQQRVTIAGALALQPRLLVLDEPFAYLDEAGARQLRETLRTLRQRGVSLIIAEHRLDRLAGLVDRIVVLAGGRLVAVGSPEALSVTMLANWGLEAPSPMPPPLGRTPSTAPIAIAWQGVWAERGRRGVLRGLSLAVATGERLAVLGPNGAGKTTLLLHGNGILRPRAGQVVVLGRPVGRRPVSEMAQAVGYVGQVPRRLLYAATVAAELAVGPRALRRDEPTWRAALAERLALVPLLQRVPQRLSAGEQRRVAVAAVMASRPAVLLLDEPTVGLDADGRRELAAMLSDQSVLGGTTCLVATHDLRWAVQAGFGGCQITDGTIVEAA